MIRTARELRHASPPPADQTRLAPCSGRHRNRLVAGDFEVLDVGYVPDQRLGLHAHREPAINYVVAGGFRETSPHADVTCAPEDLYVRAAEEPHSNHYGPLGARIVVIKALPVERNNRVLESVFGRTGTVSSFAASLFGRQIRSELEQSDAATSLAVEGLVLGLLGAIARAESGKRGTQPARWVGQVRDYIDSHCLAPIQLRDLATLAGVHPASLARAFKRQYGVTPWQYQRRLQLDWVRRELTQTDRTITEIAHEAGFADHSHLHRAFHLAMGISPSAVRRGLDRRSSQRS